MEKQIKEKSKKKIVINIISYVLLGIFFLFAVIGIIFKFTGNTINLFGNRLDVVLTDSMSMKNPQYEEFLEGHDNQIQPLDVVVTNTNYVEEDLDVYDIVLFYNADLKVTDMHRIVGKTLRSVDEINIKHAEYKTINGIRGFSFNDVAGGIGSNAISATEISLVTFSLEKDDREHFSFSYSTGFYQADVSVVEKDGGYYTTYHVLTGTTSPRIIAVSHKCEYDYSSEIVTSYVIKTDYRDIDVKEQDLVIKDDGFQGEYNKSYFYEIRGDKSNVSDGTKFTRDHIFGEVVTTIPKLGYVVNYLSGIWGIILFIGLGLIIIAYDTIAKIIDKKEAAASRSETNETPIEEVKDPEEKEEKEDA